MWLSVRVHGVRSAKIESSPAESRSKIDAHHKLGSLASSHDGNSSI